MFQSVQRRAFIRSLEGAWDDNAHGLDASAQQTARARLRHGVELADFLLFETQFSGTQVRALRHAGAAAAAGVRQRARRTASTLTA